MRGADVVASDLTPELFEPGRRRAAEHGVELEWVEADAEALPFEDASFDAVISTFGIMFAPRQSVAAGELAGSSSPGAASRSARGDPPGSSGRCSRRSPAFMSSPPPPEGPPVRWGIEEGVHALLDGAFDISCEESTLYERYDGDVDEMTDFFMDEFGPMVMARRALEPQGRWDEFLDRLPRAHAPVERRRGRQGGPAGRLPPGERDAQDLLTPAGRHARQRGWICWTAQRLPSGSAKKTNGPTACPGPPRPRGRARQLVTRGVDVLDDDLRLGPSPGACRSGPRRSRSSRPIPAA